MNAFLLVLMAAVLPASQTDARVRISMERTGCFGTCPVYTVELREDGSVTYTGRDHVRVTGAQSWRIDPAAVVSLAREMEKAGFFELRDEYTDLRTDFPTTYVTLTSGGRAKKVKDYVAGPPELKRIQDRIDAVAGTKKYVRGQDPLLDAILAGNVEGVRQALAAGANARDSDEHNVTLVMRAAETGHAEIVRLLLAAGGDPTARDRDGRNAADRARDGLASGSPRDYALILKLLVDE